MEGKAKEIRGCDTDKESGKGLGWRTSSGPAVEQKYSRIELLNYSFFEHTVILQKRNSPLPGVPW